MTVGNIQQEVEQSEVQSNEDVELGYEIVDKVEGKPGFDPEEGLYYVAGSVTLSQIFTRAAGTTIAPAIGYKLTEYKRNKDGSIMLDENQQPVLGNSIYLSKEEGVELVARYGVRNAYIVTRQRSKKDKQTGEVLIKETITYLQPFPARTEAFTQDDRLVNVYKYDESGRYAKPFELMLKEEECTAALWRIIQEDFAKKVKNSKRKSGGRNKQTDHIKNMNVLKQTLSKGSFVVNPFAKK